MERSPSAARLVFDFVDSHKLARHFVFEQPLEIISTTSISEVRSCFQAVERGVSQGLYAAGYVAYEAAPGLDSALQVRPDPPLPLVWFGLFSGPILPADPPLGIFQLSAWQPDIERPVYDCRIAKVREAISCGDTYQVNYGFRLRAQFHGDDYAFYRQLVAAQRAPYCAWLNLGRHRLLSISPELFFHWRGNRLTTRPMKGTSRRGRWAEEDEALAAQLYQSEKNRAENVMIVDLVRNDLGRIAETGSVQVRKLFELERYPTLWQMTSTIEARTRPGLLLEDIFAALFPSGSITGAPKVSTMKIIAGLENSPRNVYCGAIGFITPEREATFNVAIRTVHIDTESAVAEYGVGGGITWDSTPEDEYQEALDKAAVLSVKPWEFELLETMCFENGSFVLLDRHLDRLQSSALYFDFPFSPERVRDELASVAANGASEPQRVRLLVSSSGEVRCESQPLAPLPAGEMTVALAARPVSRNDLFLHHKTTERRLFAELKSDFPNAYDVLLWNEEREVTEFTTGNLVASLNGELITPPLDSGVLAGTLRAQLISEGKIRERALALSELTEASELWLINSVRGWVQVCLGDQAPPRSIS